MSAGTTHYVYVDETGDRGWGGVSSPIFGLSAVVVARDRDAELRDALGRINTNMRRRRNNPLHWSTNVKDHPSRKMVARELVTLPITIINVVVCKKSLMGSGTALSRPQYQYNYPVRRLLERVSWFVRNDGGGLAYLTFAHVKRFKYGSLYNYLDGLRWLPDCTIAWDHLENGRRPKIAAVADVRGLQIADLTAGCMMAAVRPDEHGDTEPSYLRTIAPRLWTGPTGRLETYGLHFITGGGSHRCGDHFDWLASVRAACA